MASDQLRHLHEVRAVVSEKDGEISCSIEETNRIRALLGMRPLDASSGQQINQEQAAVLNLKRKIDEETKTIETAEILERIEKSRNRRLLHSKLEGDTLGELAQEDDLSLLSAADWVKRSRQKQLSDQEKAKQAAALAARKLEVEEEERVKTYRTAELKGLRVMHGANSFEAGEEVILTLADTQILKRGEHGQLLGVHEDSEDVLVNPLMMDEEKRVERERQAKRARQPVYSGYDDAEFSEERAPGMKPSILSHYDKAQKSAPRLTLGEDGAALDEKVMESLPRKNQQDLGMEISISNDFYSPVEYATFNKPKKLKKIKKMRRKDEAEDDIIASLEATAREEQSSHLGKRETSMLVTSESLASERRRLNYEEAAKAAHDKISRAALESNKVAFVDDDDLEIVQSLNRVRRMVLKEKSKGTADNDPGAKVLQEFLRNEPPPQADHADEMDDFNDIDAEGRRRDGTLVFTSTTEFSTRLSARLSEVARSRAEEVVRDQEERDMELVMSEAMDGSSDMEVSVDVSEAADQEVVEFVHKQPLAAQGMAAALSLIRESGDLKANTELAGRAKDDRAYDPSSDDLGVRIEYRDEFGRKLTQKEAFRQLSYRFHGQGPSKKKMEKRLKEMQAKNKELFAKGATETGTMKSLVKAQEATGKAFVTIQVPI